MSLIGSFWSAVSGRPGHSFFSRRNSQDADLEAGKVAETLVAELEKSLEELRPFAEHHFLKKQTSSMSSAEEDALYLDDAMDEAFSFCRALEKCVFFKAVSANDPAGHREHIVIRLFDMLEGMQSMNVDVRNVLGVIAQCNQSLTTDVGLVRGFWRQVLNTGCCASIAAELFAASEIVRNHYKPGSVWRTEALREPVLRVCREVDRYRWNLAVDSFALNELPVYLRDVIEFSKQRRRFMPGSPRGKQQQQTQHNNDSSPGLNLLGKAFTTIEQGLEGIIDNVDSYAARATRTLESMGAVGGVPLFGSPLEALLTNERRSHYAFLERHIGAPKMIMQCIHRISQEIDTEGLFRAPVHAEELAELRSLLESEHGIPDHISTLAVGQILLDWLKALPVALIPQELFAPVIACWTIPEPEARIRNLRLLMDHLPWSHKPVITRVLHLFERACHSPVNGLTPSIMAVIAAPLLMRGEYKKPSHNDSDVVSRAVDLTVLMIENYEEVFGTVIAELDAFSAALNKKCEKLLWVQVQVSEQLNPSVDSHTDALHSLWDQLVLVAELRQGRVRSPSIASVAAEEPEPDRRTRRASSEGHQFSLNSIVWNLCGMNRDRQDRANANELPSELKQVGLLTILSLTTFLTTYPTEGAEIILRFAVDRMQYCSSGQAAGLLTNMCSEILDLLPTPERPKVVPRMFARSPFWTLFDDPAAFEQIFAIAMLLFDKEWIAHTSLREVSANPDTPKACLTAVRTALTQLVKANSGKSMHELKEIVLAMLPEYQTRDPSIMPRRRASSESAKTPDSGATVSVRTATMPIGDKRVQAYFKDMPEAFTKVHSQLQTSVWGKVTVLNKQIAEEMEAVLPIEHQSKDWWLVYSINNNGASLHTLLERCKNMSPTLFFVRDTNNCVFGGYSRTPWAAQRDKYYGTASTMVFTFKDGMIQSYKATYNNNYYCLTSEDSFAMGGGGNFAVYLDAEFLQGTSGPCATFDSPCLAGTEDFECDAFEMYVLKPGHPRMVDA